MTRRAHWGGLSLMLAPFGAWALGLGDIELRSALNQPLDADIALVSVTSEELADLRVALADPATFDRYGLDRPGFLGRLSFGIGRDEMGRSVIRVTSVEPITEPFVTVLVEATWPRGRLLREYTVLLDPPVMLPAEAAIEPVQPAATRMPEPSQPAAVIERPTPPPAAEPVPQPAPAPMPVAPVTSPRAAPAPTPTPATAPTPTPATAPAPTPAPVAEVAESPPRAPAGAYGPVQRGETLWGIASRSRPTGITMNQMMVAIYEANPAAFSGNMNILREGATLEMPSAAALAARTAAAATEEAIRQTAEWESGVQQARLRLLPPEVETGTSVAVAAGSADTPASSTAIEPPSTEPVDAPATADEPVESERILSIEDEALRNLQQLAEEPAVEVVEPEAADAPTNVDALVEPGVDLEAEELFANETVAGDEGAAAVADPAETIAPVDEAVDEEIVAPPPRTVSSQAVTTPSSPSLVSTIIGWLTAPLLWMVAGLLALVGAGFVYLRSRQADEEDVTGRWESLDDDGDDLFDAREATEQLRSQVRIDDETIVVEEQHTQELPEPERTADELFDVGEAEDEEVEFEGLPDVDLDDDFSTPPAPTEAADVAETVETSPTVEEEPFSPEATISSQTVINLDQADPIAEADFHMAYGLYDQAADLVSKALDADPNNRDLRLKLLEVYFVWGNRESFLDSARALRAAIGDKPDSDWDKVVIMGKQICPDEALFSDSAGGLGESVDLDLAAGDSPALDLAFEDQGDSAMDLDLGDADETSSVTLELDGGDDGADAGLDLDIGTQTAAGLEAALFAEETPKDDSAKTSPNLDLDEGEETQEAPTVEAIGPDAPTIESPMLEDTMSSSVDLPTLEQPGLGDAGSGGGDATAEIDLDDLGLDMSDLTGLVDEPTGNNPSLLDTDDDDADVLSATGVTQVLSAGDRPDEDAAFTSTEVLPPQSDDDGAATAQYPSVDADDSVNDDFGLDLDLDELSAALDGGDTVEQPGVARAGDNNGLDLDVGFDAGGNDDSTATELMPLDAQTLTEVGTKLDLARAYIDMGDPDGARSILKEVLDEGDSTQQKEAKGLIDALG